MDFKSNPAVQFTVGSVHNSLKDVICPNGATSNDRGNVSSLQVKLIDPKLPFAITHHKVKLK